MTENNWPPISLLACDNIARESDPTPTLHLALAALERDLPSLERDPFMLATRVRELISLWRGGAR